LVGAKRTASPTWAKISLAGSCSRNGNSKMISEEVRSNMFVIQSKNSRPKARARNWTLRLPRQTTRHLDMTALNRLKAQMMKAKLRKAPDAADLEEQYNTAAAAMSNRKESDIVVLDVMHNPMLAGSRNEVKAVDTKRGRERGQVEANEDMSIEDMVREERKTRGQLGGEGRRLADQIGRDAKFEVSPRSICDDPCFSC
jgi:hypothetical protein